jgi:transposase InsO family protein
MNKGKLFQNVPLLTQDNYRIWSRKILLALRAAGVEELVMEEHDSTKITTDDCQIHAAMLLCIDDDIFSFVENTHTTKEAWDILQKRYGNFGVSGALSSLRKLFSCRQGNLRMNEYLANIQQASNQAAKVASDYISVQDNLLAMIMLLGVAEEYDTVVDSIDASSDKISSNDVSAKLLRAESRRNESRQDINVSAARENGICVEQELDAARAEIKLLKSQTISKNLTSKKFCQFCRTPFANCWKDKCFNLHPELKPVRAFLNKQENLRAYSACVGINQSARWLLDTGCNRHICNQIGSMNDIKNAESGRAIKLGDDRTVAVKSSGKSYILLGDRVADVEDTLYVPDMGKNLLSVGVSTSRGLKFWFDGETCEIYGSSSSKPKGSLLCTIPKENNLYYANGAPPPVQQCQEANFSQSTPMASKRLWHERLRHGNYKAIDRLATGAARGIAFTKETEEILEKPCEGCIFGKMTRGRFSARSDHNKAKQPLERVYADVCGPFPHVALTSGAKYFLLFIDEYSRYIWVYFLKARSEVPGMIKRFTHESTRFTGKKLRRLVCLQTDNAAEFMSRSVLEFCSNEGIIHQTSVPYDHEQQGLAERPNRTILESAEAMRHHAGLKPQFWADAVAASVYLYNRFPHTSLDFRTPFEKWFNHTPNLCHVRVFGCNAWVHQQNKFHKKLTPKAYRAVFIGYADRQKAYRLWDPEKMQLVVSRDVVFDETSFTFTHDASSLSDTPSKNFNFLEILNNLDWKGSQENDSQTMIDVDAIPQDELSQDQVIETCESDSENSFDTESSTTQENMLDTQAQRPKRVRRPPGEWWNINQANAVTHSKPDYEFLLCNQANVIDELEFIEISTSLSHMQRRLIKLKRKQDDCCVAENHSNLDMPTSIRAFDIPIPKTLTEALNGTHATLWRAAAVMEMKNLRDRRTYDLMALPRDRKAIDSKWVFTVKAKADGSIEKFKARLVAKGYNQRPGIDFNETFAPVAHSESQRMLLSLVTKMKLKLRQADVLNAFLCGDIDCDIFMKQPEGFTDDELPDYVCKLNKGLYGLKQAGHLFNVKLDKYLRDNLKFVKSVADPCVYFFQTDDIFIMLSLHVDDMLFAHNNGLEMDKIMNCLDKEFGIKDLGSPEQALGIRIHHDEGKNIVYLDQSVYIQELLTRFEMKNCKSCETPHQPGLYLTESMCPDTADERRKMLTIPYRELVGALLYLATRTRPDLSYAVGQLCRFMSNPGPQHWIAAKRVLRYLQGTFRMGIKYEGSEPVTGYSDSDWAGDPDQRRSTAGILFMMSSGPVSWKSHRQRSVALSALEAEYVSLSLAAREASWTKSLLSEIFINNFSPISVHCDNQGAISIAKNRRTDSRTKHIDVRYHFTRDKIEDGTMSLHYLQTEIMPADYLTKPIDVKKFIWCRQATGMIDIPLRGCVEINELAKSCHIPACSQSPRKCAELNSAQIDQSL